MKKSKFTDAQIAFVLRQAEEGTPVGEVCRKAGISDATFYNWRKKYAGLMPSEMKRLKQLEEENGKLKRLVADLSLDKFMLQDVIKVDPDLIQIAIATAYPGTVFYREAKENRWLVSEDPKCFDATGKSAVSYPDYPADKIEEMFHLGWKLWYRHVLLEKPKTLWFFFTSEVRRDGLVSTIKKSAAYLPKAFGK